MNVDLKHIAESLGGAKSTSNGYDCRCPAHNDEKASLSISQGDDVPILVHCKRGCLFDNIKDALKNRGLWPESERDKLKDSLKNRKETISHKWKVRTIDGSQFSHKVRQAGKKMRWDPPLGELGLKNKDMALYNIDNALESDEIVICEGEKAADYACKLGLAAVGTGCGASSIPADGALSELTGKSVILWPDNDDAGYEHMRKISIRLSELGIKNKTIYVPGAHPKDDAEEFFEAGGTLDKFSKLPEYGSSSKKMSEINGRGPDDDDSSCISHLLQRSKKKDGSPGKELKTNYNLDIILSEHKDWKDALTMNERKGVVYIKPGTPVTKGNKESVAMTDVYAEAIKQWVEGEYRLTYSDNAILSVSHLIGYKSRFDPVVDYFESLKWCGKSKVETWLIDYAGADDTPYTRAVSKRFLISVVARQLSPGCKVDTVMILGGEQGARKSTLFETLAVNGYFADRISQIGTKDAMTDIRALMILELAELDALNKKESTAVKAFISSRTDHYRDHYGKLPEDHPRRCVIVGSTNESGFLKDSTGGRRFWPVQVKKIDIEGLKKAKDQLWAEAVSLYKSGEQWWLTEEEEKLAAVEQEASQDVGTFDDLILNYLLLKRSAISQKWFYNFDDDGIRRYVAIEEIKELLKMEEQPVQWNSIQYAIKPSIERVLGGNKREKKRIASFGRKYLTVYIVPEKFRDRHLVPPLKSIDGCQQTIDIEPPKQAPQPYCQPVAVNDEFNNCSDEDYLNYDPDDDLGGF